MVDRVIIEIDNADLKEVERKLKRLDNVTAWRQAQRPAMQKAMRPVRAAVKARAQRFNKTNAERIRQGRRPGALVRGVRMRSRTPKKVDAVSNAIFGPRLGDVLVGVYFKKSRLGTFRELQANSANYSKRPPFYVRFLEFGRKSGSGTGSLPRTDFIRREFDSRAGTVLNTYTREIKKKVDELT